GARSPAKIGGLSAPAPELQQDGHDARRRRTGPDAGPSGRVHAPEGRAFSARPVARSHEWTAPPEGVRPLRPCRWTTSCLFPDSMTKRKHLAIALAVGVFGAQPVP